VILFPASVYDCVSNKLNQYVVYKLRNNVIQICETLSNTKICFDQKLFDLFLSI